MDRRYARENSGLCFFTDKDPIMSKELRELMAFREELCSPTTLRKGESKRIIIRGEGCAMFSGQAVKAPRSLVAA
jgi:hypothetical protein